MRALTPTYHNSLDSIIAHKGNLIHLTGNNAVEIYKVKKQTQLSKSDLNRRTIRTHVPLTEILCFNPRKPSKPRQSAIRDGLSDIYLPAITGKMSNLQAARAKLSHSCPYLFTSRRRGSTSSINSQRAPDFSKQVSRSTMSRD